MKNKLILILCAILPFACFVCADAGNYKNFKVSVYVRAQEVAKMKDYHWMDSTWNIISRQMDVDEIFLETHRDRLLVDQETITKAKEYFKGKGLEVSGGITYTISEPNYFETFSYSDPKDRAAVKEIAEFTARNFDKFLLDDFFFTSSKKDVEIAAKGNKSWTEYRLERMTEAGRDLVLDPAKKVNPKVKVIIKYPNWYDHFQGLGFDLEHGPQIFDGIWTGTETRDPAGDQHLQNYLSYNIIRYFENLRPGHNGGGWVDSGGIQMSADRYSEQLFLTMLAKAPQIMLFAYNQLIGIPLRPEFRAPWQDQNTSFNYSAVTSSYKLKNGQEVKPTTIARLAGVTLRQADELVGKLGKPVGIKSYKPFNVRGEDFLQNYLGMIGLPMDMYPEFPEDQKVVLLTAQAAKDPGIISEIKKQLAKGGNVFITSGFLKSAQEKVADIAELECADQKALVNDFGRNGKTLRDILIPQVHYYTNDAWEIVSAGRPLTGGVSGYPILLMDQYSKGSLYVLTIPDDMGNLYDYPEAALNLIRERMSKDLGVYLEGPSKVCIFVYDNKTVVVENFNDVPVEAGLVFTDKVTSVESLDGSPVPTEKGRVSFNLLPHSYKAYRFK